MALKVSVYIATSLDGFIARKNGGLDWLPTPREGDEDYGYAEFMSTVDNIVMGRNTFEKVLSFGNWPYEKKVVVLTSQNLTLPSELADKVEIASLPPRKLVQHLEQHGVRHIYLDGGLTIQGFLREGLIHEMIITTIPILIGNGLPLFGQLAQDIKLELLESKSFMSGLTQNKYKVL